MTYDLHHIIIATLLINNIMCFCIGYLISLSRYKDGVSIKGNSSLKKEPKIFSDKKEIQINDKKFVTDINTDKLEKKYSDLGDIKTSNESISSSIDKLKNMKG